MDGRPGAKGVGRGCRGGREEGGWGSGGHFEG